MMGPRIAPPCRITLPGSKFSTQLEGAPLVANGLTMLFNYPAFSSPLAQNSMRHTRNVDCLLFPMMCVYVFWRLLCKHCDSPQFPSYRMLYRMCITIACMCIHLVPANSAILAQSYGLQYDGGSPIGVQSRRHDLHAYLPCVSLLLMWPPRAIVPALRRILLLWLWSLLRRHHEGI